MNIHFFKLILLALSIFLTSCSGCSKSSIRSLQDKQSTNRYQTEISENTLSVTTETSNTSETIDFTIGKVIAVLDGDTYDLLINGNQTIRIRMEGIDAPERGMPYYQVAKKYLSNLCFGNLVKFVPTKKPDSHNRLIGFTYLEDGTEMSHEMIKAGLAWHFKKYNSDEDLAELEIQARNSKIGLWQNENPMSPWENRRLHKQGISTKKMFN